MKEETKITIRQMIFYEQECNRKKLLERCLMRGFHKPYPDGYFERCFSCGTPLTPTLLKEDRLNELRHEYLDLMSKYSENENVDMFRLYRVAQEIGISI